MGFERERGLPPSFCRPVLLLTGTEVVTSVLLPRLQIMFSTQLDLHSFWYLAVLSSRPLISEGWKLQLTVYCKQEICTRQLEDWTFLLLTHDRIFFHSLQAKCYSAALLLPPTLKWHCRIPVLIPSFINLSVCKERHFAECQAPPGPSSTFVLSFHISFPTILPLEQGTADSAQNPTPAHLPTAVPPLQRLPHQN